jgi:hypothetical protein
MKDCSERLEELSMKPLGRIYIDRSKVIRVKADANDLQKGIYAWVECDGKANPAVPQSVLYVGKFGKTLAMRCLQHESGLANTNSKVGVRNAAALSASINSGKEVAIYARQSKRKEIFKEIVSLNDAEEEAANLVLKPSINPSSRKAYEKMQDDIVEGKEIAIIARNFDEL